MLYGLWSIYILLFTFFQSFPIQYLCHVCMKQWHTCNHVLYSKRTHDFGPFTLYHLRVIDCTVYRLDNMITHYQHNLISSVHQWSLISQITLEQGWLLCEVEKYHPIFICDLCIPWFILPHCRSATCYIYHSLYNIYVCLSIYHHADCVE